MLFSSTASDCSKPCVALLGAQVAAHQVGHEPGQDAPQPGGELGFGRAAKLMNVAMRFEAGFLHQVGRVGLALQPPADLRASQQRQVLTIEPEQGAERLAIAAQSQAEQFIGTSVRQAHGSFLIHCFVWDRKGRVLETRRSRATK